MLQIYVTGVSGMALNPRPYAMQSVTWLVFRCPRFDSCPTTELPRRPWWVDRTVRWASAQWRRPPAHSRFRNPIPESSSAGSWADRRRCTTSTTRRQEVRISVLVLVRPQHRYVVLLHKGDSNCLPCSIKLRKMYQEWLPNPCQVLPRSWWTSGGYFGSLIVFLQYGIRYHV